MPSKNTLARRRAEEIRQQGWENAFRASRPCGGCTECCTAMAVIPLKKRYWEPCPHCSNAGCQIYPSRPSECADWACVWAMGRLPESERPDHSGLLFTYSEADNDALVPDGTAILQVFETRAGVFAKDWDYVFNVAMTIHERGIEWRDGRLVRAGCVECIRFGTPLADKIHLELNGKVGFFVVRCSPPFRFIAHVDEGRDAWDSILRPKCVAAAG